MKITNTIRGRLLEEILDRAFNGPREEITKRKTELAEKILREEVLLPGHPEVISGLPKNFLETTSRVRVLFSGKMAHLSLKNPETPIPQYAREAISFESGHPLCEIYHEIESDRKSLNESEQSLRAQAEAVLNSCTTDTTLFKTWPEIRPIFEALFPVESKKYEVVVPNELNIALKLVKEDM